MTASNTHEQLVTLFADASQAVQRLLWFAETADVDGYPDVASTFRTIAEEKAGHARGLLEFIDGFDSETSENLASAIQASSHGNELQTVRDVAMSEGRSDVAEWIDTLVSASQRHLELLENSKQTLR